MSSASIVGLRRGAKGETVQKLRAMLARFGYASKSESDEFDESFEQALRLYQALNRLSITGIVDDETRSRMLLPRCGNRDIDEPARIAYTKFLLSLDDPHEFRTALNDRKKETEETDSTIVCVSCNGIIFGRCLGYITHGARSEYYTCTGCHRVDFCNKCFADETDSIPECFRCKTQTWQIVKL